MSDTKQGKRALQRCMRWIGRVMGMCVALGHRSSGPRACMLLFGVTKYLRNNVKGERFV